MVQSVNYDVINFYPETGTLEIYIRELGYNISIEVPIEDNRFITGDNLLHYISGFIPLHTIQRNEQLKSVQNFDEFSKFINISKNEQSISDEIRSRRHQLLLNCDWVVLPDAGFSKEQMKVFLEYRQKLRDVPQQSGFPYNIEWPSCDGEWMNHPGVKKYDELPED